MGLDRGVGTYAAPAATPCPPPGQGDPALELLRRLPQIGPVLCLHAAPSARPAARVRRAAWPMQPEVQALVFAHGWRAEVRVDPRGPEEWLWALGPDGAARFGIGLLPDSDFHAWDALMAQVPATAVQSLPHRLVRLATGNALPGYGWWGGVNRFVARDRHGHLLVGVEACAGLSPLGAQCVARAVRERGARMRHAMPT